MSKEIIKYEDIELLIRDLSSRLPYDVIVQDRNGVHKLRVDNTEFIDLFAGKCNIKPYLRPMSSMTEGEKKEYELLVNRCISTSVGFMYFEAQELINWLLKNHFDYDGLIPRGLAIEVTKENNPYKN